MRIGIHMINQINVSKQRYLLKKLKVNREKTDLHKLAIRKVSVYILLSEVTFAPFGYKNLEYEIFVHSFFYFKKSHFRLPHNFLLFIFK